MAKSVDRVARGRSHGYDVLRGFNGQATTGFRRRFVPYLGEIIARPHPDSTMQALATSRSLPSCE